MVSVPVSIQMRKMCVEVRKTFLNARHAERVVHLHPGPFNSDNDLARFPRAFRFHPTKSTLKIHTRTPIEALTGLGAVLFQPHGTFFIAVT